MNRKELMDLMSNAGINGRSKLNMRSEVAQKKSSAKRIPRLKKAVKKKSKLLVIAELAVPFNPETGEADDQFNPEFKYRPPFSATSTALLLKGMANENAKTKEVFMKRAGISEWDTSDLDSINEVDKKVFSKYRVPRIYTIPVCHVNIPKMCGNNFGRDYAVYVERDDKGQVVGEMPGFLKINKLFRDICYEKIADLNKKIESGEEVLTEQQQKDKKSDFRREIAVSDDNPSNWVQLVELPLTAKYAVSSEAISDAPTADTINDLVVINKYTKAIEECVKAYTSGDLEMFDKYFDFFEIDMVCPTEGDDSTNQGKMLLGKDTKFEKATIKLEENENAKVIEEAVREYVDRNLDIEETVRRSTFVSDYNEEVENQIYTSLKTVLNITDNPFITQKVIKDNQEVIMLAYPDEGAMLVEEVDAGVSDKDEGELDSEGSVQVGREAKYDLSDSAFSDESGEEVASDTSSFDDVSVELETFAD